MGLVSALLSGKAPLPQQRQSGCLIHPGKTMGTTFAEPLARNRILVCAATNQAVDSLAWKIKQGSGKCSTSIFILYLLFISLICESLS